MNTIKNIIAAATLSALSVGYFGAAQAAETIKPLQGVSFHTATKDAVAYFTADQGTCKVVLTLTDKAVYAPARFEKPVEARKSILHQVDDGTALEFACQEHAQAMTINLISTVANEH